MDEGAGVVVVLEFGHEHPVLTVHRDRQQVLGRVFACFEQLRPNTVEVGQKSETAASGVMEPYWKATRSEMTRSRKMTATSPLGRLRPPTAWPAAQRLRRRCPRRPAWSTWPRSPRRRPSIPHQRRPRVAPWEARPLVPRATSRLAGSQAPLRTSPCRCSGGHRHRPATRPC